MEYDAVRDPVHEGETPLVAGSSAVGGADPVTWAAAAPPVPRTLTLEAVPTSVPAARQFVLTCLEGTEAAPRADDVALAATELVTNAVLHGREPIVVSVQLVDGGVRVEVRDGSALSPAFSMLDPTAVTGRGLLLVSAVSDRWGVDPDGEGKVVWFVVGVTSPTPEDDPDETTRLLLAWGDELEVDPAEEVVRVVLTDLDTAAAAASEAHTEGVLRELTLIAGNDDDPQSGLAGRLLQEALPLDQLRGDVRRQVAAAVLEGRAQLDVTVTVRREHAEQVRDFMHALDEADRLASAGELLMPRASDEVTSTRRAFLRRLLDQLRS